MLLQSGYMLYASLDGPIGKHVQEFSDLLLAKGYTNMFHIGHEATDKFPDGLKDHIETAFRKQQDFTLFYCHGYTDWNGPDRDSVSIFFKVNYTPERGFLIGNVDINRKSMYGVKLASATVNPANNEAMPTPEECNRMVSEQKQHNTNKPVHVHKFPASPRRHKRGFKH